ncbi:hypothetical protein BH23CHL10_BH23CHL10_16830 [soil metagenome]
MASASGLGPGPIARSVRNMVAAETPTILPSSFSVLPDLRRAVRRSSPPFSMSRRMSHAARLARRSLLVMRTIMPTIAFLPITGRLSARFHPVEVTTRFAAFPCKSGHPVQRTAIEGPISLAVWLLSPPGETMRADRAAGMLCGLDVDDGKSARSGLSQARADRARFASRSNGGGSAVRSPRRGFARRSHAQDGCKSGTAAERRA